MKNWFALIYLSVVIIIFAGCSKGGTIPYDDNVPHVINNTDTIAPVVEIYTPAGNQVFNSGNVINVTGKVTDGDGLYQGSIRIINDANGSVVKEQLYEIHGLLQYDFNISHTASVTAAADYTVTVQFEDHGLNTNSKSVKVKINP